MNSPVNKDLSQQLFSQLALNTKVSIKHCAHNAFRVLPYLVGANYIEGWAVAQEKFLVFEHAWLEHDAEIIDPTLWMMEIAYFPGLWFAPFDVEQALANNNKLPLAHTKKSPRLNTPSNSNDPDYWKAWEEATQFAESQKRGKLWGRWERMWFLKTKPHTFANVPSLEEKLG